MMLWDAEQQEQYQAWRQRCGYAPLARTQIAVSGEDRATLLHNLCTNDIKRLQPGQGCEAVFTNVQGKAIAFGFLFIAEHEIYLDMPAGQSDTIMAHLDRYVIMEDVELKDLSDARLVIAVAGAEAQRVLTAVWGTPPETAYSHSSLDDVRCCRVPWAGEHCFFLSLPKEHGDTLVGELEKTNALACTVEVADCCRIEQGMPEFGADISDQNLPQELDRVEQSISFTKGCYLGQETVARIDALGHVNWLLRGLRFEGNDLPASGSEIEVDGKAVARLRSVTFSPALQAPLALAYLRSGWEESGRTFPTPWGVATVVTLPVVP